MAISINASTSGITLTSGGITFNANPGGGTQATLNDYEVGTFTVATSTSITVPSGSRWVVL